MGHGLGTGYSVSRSISQLQSWRISQLQSWRTEQQRCRTVARSVFMVARLSCLRVPLAYVRELAPTRARGAPAVQAGPTPA